MPLPCTAQGVTADTAHAVLGESTTRSLLYVAMTRGREANAAYLHERVTEQEYRPIQADGPHVLQRGTSDPAGWLARAIIATDDVPVTAHDIAAQTPETVLPERVQRLAERRQTAIRRRLATFESWHADVQRFTQSMDRARATHASRSRAQDHGLEM